MGGGAKTTTKTNETSNQTVQLPQWMIDAGQNLYGQASAQAQNNPATRYTGQMTPSMAGNQVAAGNVAANAAAAGNPDLDNARAATMAAANASARTVQTRATGAMGMNAAQANATGYRPAQQQTPTTMVGAQQVGSQNFDGQQAQTYMNPYTQNVQQNTLAEMRRQNQMETDSLGDSAQASKAYGGARHAVLESETRGRQNSNMMDYLDASNAAAFTNAQGQFNTDRQAGMTADLANQGANLNADTFNMSLIDQLLGRNTAALNEAGQFNASSANSANQANADRSQAASGFNASAANAATQSNADRSLQASGQNAQIGQSMLDRLLSAGGQFANIGNQQQGQTSQQINDLLRTGAVEQATAGDAQSADYQEFLRMQNAPMEQYQNLMAILSGTPRNVTTSGTSSGTNVSKQSGGLLNQLLGAGQIAASFASDRALKRDIELVGRRDDGLGVYEFRYIWDADDAPLSIGVMADEVEELMPEALGPIAGGRKTVNYALIGG